MSLLEVVGLLIEAAGLVASASDRPAGQAHGAKRERIQPARPAQQPLPPPVGAEQLGIRLDRGALVARSDGHTLTLEPQGTEGGAIADGKLHSILDTPLDLGLRITRRLFAPVGSAGLTGDPELDSELDFEADEAVRLRQLLDHGPLRDVLRRLCKDDDWTEISDRGIAARFALTDRAEMTAWLTRTRPLLSHLHDARSRVRSAEALRDLVDGWRAFAAANQLRYGEVPLRVSRADDGFDLGLEAVRIGRGRYAFELTARFDEPLGIGLTSRKARLGDRIGEWFGRKDIQFGDDAFDRQFEVSVEPPSEQRGRDILAEEARSDCLRLAALFDEIQIDDAEIRATTAAMAKDQLEAIHIARRLAVGMLERARCDQQKGAYR